MWAEKRRGKWKPFAIFGGGFTGCLGADAGIEIRIITAYKIDRFRDTQKAPRDELLKLPDWPTKLAILGIFREQQGLEIEGVQTQVYYYCTEKKKSKIFERN